MKPRINFMLLFSGFKTNSWSNSLIVSILDCLNNKNKILIRIFIKKCTIVIQKTNLFLQII